MGLAFCKTRACASGARNIPAEHVKGVKGAREQTVEAAWMLVGAGASGLEKSWFSMVTTEAIGKGGQGGKRMTIVTRSEWLEAAAGSHGLDAAWHGG